MKNEAERRRTELKEIFQFYITERNKQYMTKNLVEGLSSLTEVMEERELERWQRVSEDVKDKKTEIIHSDSRVQVLTISEEPPYYHIYYRVLINWGIKHYYQTYEQSWMESRVCTLLEEDSWQIISDSLVEKEGEGSSLLERPDSVDVNYQVHNPNERRPRYNRVKAVQYAEKWWNDYNPKFKKFDVDCTNYISQCLWAGGAPMKHSSNRAKGNWSYSWAVAHSLRWYLPSSNSGLRGKEVSSADQLKPGDVICYDFTGDGHWQHNTIVVTKDGAGMPLVNAHTTNSRHRYWDYRDSYAWTQKTAYKFFQIIDEF